MVVLVEGLVVVTMWVEGARDVVGVRRKEDFRQRGFLGWHVIVAVKGGDFRGLGSDVEGEVATLSLG